MNYVTILGSIATAQDQVDFDAAVNAAGGPSACIGGQSISGDRISQAVSVSPAVLAKLAAGNVNCIRVVAPLPQKPNP